MSELSDLSTLAVVKRLKDNLITADDLPKEIRRNVVGVLRHDHSGEELSHLLGVCRDTIWRDIQHLKNHAAELIKDITVNKVASDLIEKAEKCSNKAWKDGNVGMYWQIQKDLTQCLQNLGCLHRAPTEITAEIEAGPALIKLLGKNNGDGRTFGESWRDGYRDAARSSSN